jgi:beta-lactamase superfamily II metal-dependent hydrolase
LNKIKIEMFPALYGDCFLVSFPDENQTNILIDSGFQTNYSILKKRLQELSKAGKCIDLLVITHIDIDHISGSLKLLSENKNYESPKIIKIKEIWHNSFRHLQFNKRIIGSIETSDKEIIEAINSKGWVNENEKRTVKIGAKQGSSLARLILEGKYPWNTNFKGKAIMSDAITNDIQLTPEIRIRILSPNLENLKDLEELWLKELRKKKYNFKLTNDEIFDDAFEFMISWQKEKLNKKGKTSAKPATLNQLFKKKIKEDDAVPNGSSIAFVIEYMSSKLLFLGDSFPSVIKNNLKSLIEKEKYVPFFDVIKASHHGSKKNTNDELLKIIDSGRFLFSTNGENFNHPDPETMAKIVCRDKKIQRKLIFNYPTKTSQFMDNNAFKKKYNYSVDISDGKTIKVIEIETNK